jgi:hypothetical protein
MVPAINPLASREYNNPQKTATDDSKSSGQCKLISKYQDIKIVVLFFGTLKGRQP